MKSARFGSFLMSLFLSSLLQAQTQQFQRNQNVNAFPVYQGNIAGQIFEPQKISKIALGGIHGGGGNGLHSTVEQVTKFIDGHLTLPASTIEIGLQTQLLKLIRDVEERLRPSANAKIQTQQASAILSKIIKIRELSYEMSSVIHKNEIPGNRGGIFFIKNSSSACADSGKSKEASVQTKMIKSKIGYDYRQIWICLSVGRLTKYSPKEMPKQITYLVMHELAHVVGYGEEDAIYIQKFLNDNIELLCRIQLVVDMDQPGDGRYRGSQFWIDIYPGMIRYPRVNYHRYYSPATEKNSGNNIITTETLNTPEEFELKWSPEEGGYLSFNHLNDDGTYSSQSLKWGKMEYETFPWSEYISRDFQESNININGKKFVLKSLIRIYKSCLL